MSITDRSGTGRAPAENQQPQQAPPPPAASGRRGAKSRNRSTSGGGSAQGQSWLKEIVTVVIALAVVGVSGWLLVNHYFSVKPFVVTNDLVGKPALYAAAQQAYQQYLSNQQDVLNIALGIVGVILGYFFGRVPAELRASKAEEVAQGNARTAADAVEDSHATRAKLDDVKKTLSALSIGGGALLGGNQSHAKVEVDALLRRIG